MAGEGLQEIQSLQAGGFSGDEITAWQQQTTQKLTDAGFSGKEVDDYFGKPPEPDMSDVRDHIHNNLKENQASTKPAKDMWDAFVAGLEGSSGGLIVRQKMPDVSLPDEHNTMMGVAAQAGGLLGDVPAMVTGIVLGGVAGSAVPGVGNAAGAMAGAFALPAALRKAYVDHIQKGDIQDFSDFWGRTANIANEAAKGTVTGLATYLTGGASEALLAGAPVVTKVMGTQAAQLAAMVTTGKALEGEVPHPSDFAEAAILLAGLHGVVSTAADMPAYAKNIQSKLQNTYAETGLKPADVLTAAASDPVLKEQLLASGDKTPESLKPVSDITQGPGMQKANIPKELLEGSNVLGKGFTGEDEHMVEKPPEVEPPKPTSAEDDGAEKTPQEQVLARIGEEGKKPSTTLSQVYTRALDSINPVKQLTDAITGGAELPAGEDPNILTRLANAYGGKAEITIDHGPRDFATGEPTGTPGLKEILKPFKGDLDGFTAYAMSARAIELEDIRDIRTGVPLEAARKVVEEGSAKYEKGFQQLVEFQNQNLKYLRDAGILSEEGHQKILNQNQSYLPFNRVQEEAGSTSKGKGGLNPIKDIHGSELPLVNPIESIIRNTFAYMKVAEQNRARTALVDLAFKTDGGTDFVQRVPETMKPITVSEYEVKRYLSENGVQEVDPTSFEIFRPLSLPLAKDEIAIMRDGRREVYKVGEDAAKALNATAYSPPNLIMKAIAIPAKMLRTGAVETPDFLARHFIRDNVNAFVMSNNDYVPVVDAIRGLSEYLKEGKGYQEWLSSGGGMSNFISMDRDYVQNKVFELSKDTGLMDKVRNLAKNPLEIMRAAAEAITSAPRIGEFMKAREAGKDLPTAAYDSRNVTIDNQRMGSDPAIKAISMITAFWNTHVQGVDKMLQAFKDDPVRTATKMSLAVTLPSVLLWAKNKDDPRYQELPRWQKDLFWIVLTDNHVFRIPKPFEQGIFFGSLPERMLEHYYAHNPDAFKGFAEHLTAGALPNPIPNAFMPALEQFANRSWLTGGNLVSHGLEKVAPEFQYNAYTSETAKQLGKFIATVPGIRDIGHDNITLASPIVIQNYVRSWGGGMGMYALQLADKALEKAGVTPQKILPTQDLADMPFFKAFAIRHPSAQAQSIQDFYDNLNVNETARDTAQMLMKSGKASDYERWVSGPAGEEMSANLKGIAKGLAVQNALIGKIYGNPDISPDAQRQQIDGLYMQMIQAAKFGNQMMQQVKERK